ncbi:hypothetical protein YA0745_25470 [Pseudomonas synxantha]|uniref:Insecticide toxin TcdB middle/N-terminal domain-containing protein n=1 Tax=Pseudomonas synxantha TaxID=47883 RepID=A0ABS0UJM9_9PSED|nr:toxin TcdB middle/N-terminal domain-containing protein [Pseudomonas synxantha]MBI6565376.1 hypothetical protein [Pseudomonas synxantha]MBI6581723.1 hypothetical protein [Pseudomonas synxantha]MBI6646277.1 hypothetical protein [Pseudomonas synxantha]
MAATAYLAKMNQQEPRVVPVNGAANWRLPLDLPSGRNGASPQVAIEHSTQRGNDLCGYGAGVNLGGRIRRRDRLEAQWSARPLVLEGVGELIEVSPGQWLPVEAALTCRVDGKLDGSLCVTHPDGRKDYYGESSATRIAIIEGSEDINVEWLIERTEIPDSDSLFYEYGTESGLPLLVSVRFGPYQLSLDYEVRPDPVIRAYGGQIQTLTMRIAAFRLQFMNPPSKQQTIRRWQLGYAQNFAGWSVLNSVTIEGDGPSGEIESWPSITLEVIDASLDHATATVIQLPDAPIAPSKAHAGTLSWFGNGRPSIYEVTDSSLRIISDESPNTIVETERVPTELFDYSSRMVFSDISGDGYSDLVLLGDDIAGHFPFIPGEGYGKFEQWHLDFPAGLLLGANAVLCDVDGDGGNEIVFFNDVTDVWEALLPGNSVRPPVLVSLTGNLPKQKLDGKALHLVDATGDGLADFVLVEADRLQIWFNRGGRDFDDAHDVPVQNSGLLRPERQTLGFADFTGDGVADFYAIEGAQVHIWINESCARYAYLGVLDLAGLEDHRDVVVCDWHGLGRSGFLWWPYEGDVRFISPMGMAALGALATVDNGLGLKQTFAWSTTSLDSSAARRSGRPWSRELPFALRVCREFVTFDELNGTSRTMQYEYEAPFFWPARRRFLGFTRSTVREIGATGRPFRSTALVHVMPSRHDPDLVEVVHAGSLKTLHLYEFANVESLIMRVEHSAETWQVMDDVSKVCAAAISLKQSIVEHIDSGGNAYSLTSVKYENFDSEGRPKRIVETATSPAATLSMDGIVLNSAQSNHTLITEIDYAVDPTKRFMDRRSCVRQTDGEGAKIAASILYYDGLDTGKVGVVGRLTSAFSLVMTEEHAALLGSEDEISELGYVRLNGESGWWRRDRDVNEKQDDQGHRVTSLRDALGHTVQSTYDASGIWVEKIETATGTHHYVPDPISNKPAREIDGFGTEREYNYDGLGRLCKIEEVGWSLPVQVIKPEFTRSGIALQIETLADEHNESTIATRESLDAYGRSIGKQILSQSGTYSLGLSRFNIDGKLIARSVPHGVNRQTGQPLEGTLPEWQFDYDALNRVTVVREPGGNHRILQYAGPWVIESDPLKPWKPRRVMLTDARGHIVLSACGDNSAMTRLQRDARGNPLMVQDLFGRESVFEYDLLGRQIRSSTPDGGEQIIVLDALGAVRKTIHSGMKKHEVLMDEAGRQASVETEGRATYTFIYQDATAGPGAGLLKEAVSAAGTATFSYDRGRRICERRYQRRGTVNELVLQYDYRLDGNLRELKLPNGASLRWNYDDIGRVISIPNFIKSVEYGTDGVLKALIMQNGVRTELERQIDRTRLRGCKVVAGGIEILRSGVVRTGGDEVSAWEDGNLRKTILADSMHRIVAVKIGDEVIESRVYDTQHRLSDIAGLALEYNSAQKLVRAGADGVRVDAMGAIVGWGPKSYQLDGKGVVSSISNGSEARHYDTDHEGRICAAYDVANQLVFYQPDPHIIQTVDALYVVIHLGALPVARARLLPNGKLGDVQFLHHDLFGRLVLSTDAAARVTKHICYDVGGLPTVAKGEIDESLDLLFEGNRFVSIGDCYLQGARLYAPRLGRFLSADVVAYDAADPLAGDRYLFSRGHPLQHADPTGLFLDNLWSEVSRAWNDWGKKLLLAVAVIVIAIYASVPVLIGMAIGAVVGGLAAYQKGGDVLEGMLVGSLLGAAGAFGAGFVSASGGGIWAAAASGAMKGAITGAAMGLAAGYAGGAGSAEDMLEATAAGALTGAVAGAVLGAAGEWLRNSKVVAPNFEVQRARFVKAFGQAMSDGSNAGNALANASTSSEFFGPYLKYGASELAKSGAWVHVTQVVVAASAGYQAGGFGKPLERVIWEDILHQKVEGDLVNRSF